MPLFEYRKWPTIPDSEIAWKGINRGRYVVMVASTTLLSTTTYHILLPFITSSQAHMPAERRSQRVKNRKSPIGEYQSPLFTQSSSY